MNDETLNCLSDGTFRARWLREVLRTSQVTESVKMLLISMAVEEMDATGRVSVPREDLAARIGRSKARVSERVQEAVDKGFLVRLSAGKKGSTAVYAAAVKGSACADPNGEGEDHGKGPDSRTESTEIGSDLQDAEPEGNGPPSRTRTFFGSDLQDAKDGETVRTVGPNGPKKGPPNRDAKVVEGVGEVVSSPTSPEDDSSKADDAASRPGPKSSEQRQAPTVAKIPFPADFAVTDDMRAWARQRAPLVDVDLETELFINYWLDKPRTKRPGWERTWQSWMLRQQGWAQQRQPSNVRQLRPTGTDGRSSSGSGARIDFNAPFPQSLDDL